MDSCEATKMVMSRIQALDPENASKIMGYILIQDQGEKEMIRLAFGPENLLHSIIKQAKAVLDISSNGSSAPSSPSLYNSTNTRQPSPFPASSPRIIIPNNGFHHLNPGSPSSPWSVTDHRSPSNHHLSPRPPCSLSYAAVVNGGSNSNSFSSPSAASSFSLPPFYSSGNACSDLSDEFGNIQLQDQLPFLDESKNGDFMDPIVSPGSRSDSILFPYGSSGLNNTASWADSGDTHHHHLHWRSCSVSDVFLSGENGAEDGGVAGGGFGWRPCMYFARGFCKNGNSCKFLHSGFGDSFEASSPTAIVGSPGKIDGFEDLLRMKAIQQQQQRIAAMAGAPFPYNRCINFLSDNQRSAAAALMMGEEFHKFGRCRPDRNDFVSMGGNANSSSRQIYLTFPADSTFKEEDVSNYFSIFGPVQDVRIPYQQKRMFGFVTFVYPETVKQILAKGNPHFVCDSRVLVKPYKEKGKIPDKKQQQQQMDRGDFSVCLSPTGLDSVEPFDHIPFGARMFNHEMMLRRKIEERAELRQAIDRRMMNLQLTELQNQHHNHQLHPSLSVAIHSPTHSHSQMNHNLILPPDDANEEDLSGDSVGGQDNVNWVDGVDTKALPGGNDVCCNDDNDSGGNGSGSGKEESSNVDDTDVNESLELNLPDNLFASPTKSASDCQSIFSPGLGDAEVNDPNAYMLPSTSSAINMAALKSCYFQMPRKVWSSRAYTRKKDPLAV